MITDGITKESSGVSVLALLGLTVLYSCKSNAGWVGTFIYRQSEGDVCKLPVEFRAGVVP